MIDKLKNIYALCPVGKALVGMDVGTKTIGVSVCDPGHMIATPLRTIKRSKFANDISVLKAIVVDYEIGGFVIGYPLNMDGSEGPRCQSVRDFAIEFERQMGLSDPWIALWDERLSTAAVEDLVGKTEGISRRQAKERGVLDKLAAQVILQGALDFMARH